MAGQKISFINKIELSIFSLLFILPFLFNASSKLQTKFDDKNASKEFGNAVINPNIPQRNGFDDVPFFITDKLVLMPYQFRIKRVK